MGINWTIDVPTIFTVVVGLLALASRLSKMEVKVDAMWKKFIGDVK